MKFDECSLPPEMFTALEKYQNSCLDAGLVWESDPLHKVSLDSRLVHDLCISGDDFDDLYPFLTETYSTKHLIPVRFIPPEISHDSYCAAMASSQIWRKIGCIREWYRSRIKCEPLTLHELHLIMTGTNNLGNTD